MKLLIVLALACIAVIVSSQSCGPAEVVFLLDHSENARRAASTDQDDATIPSFDILKDAMRTFLMDPRIANAANFRIGAYGYSSSATPNVIFPIRSTAAEALNLIDNIGEIVSAGSWTYRGMEAVVQEPNTTNNYVIIVSSQGSGNANRLQLAQQQFERITTLGWRTWVLAVQGVNNIDFVELSAVNMDGKPPQNVTEANPRDAANPKGYRGLSMALADIILDLCGARSFGLCDKCLYEGGYGFDFDPTYCDSFYQCIYPGAIKIRKLCPAGTFWDGITCNHIDKVNCPLAPCSVTTPEDTRYHSGRCCNKYFQCVNGANVEMSCPDGDIFDWDTSSCVTPSDEERQAQCEDKGRFMCDMGTGTGTSACPGFDEDPTGDPCYFMFGGASFRVPAGTYWNQTTCTLDHTSVNFCLAESVTTDRDFVLANGTCNEMFLATFNDGSRAVTSPRLNKELSIYTIYREISFADNALVYGADATDPYYYIFHYNNKDIHRDVAFRVNFKLADPEIGVDYEILSNQFCEICSGTLFFTVAATSASARTVTATFLTTAGDVVMTTAMIEKNNADNYLEMIVIFGDSRVYGQVNELNGSGAVVKTATFEEKEKTSESRILMNRCGIQLGRGATAKSFVGSIDEFAVYEMCENMSSILKG